MQNTMRKIMATQGELEYVLENASEEELMYIAYSVCQYATEHPDMPKREWLEWVNFMDLVTVEAERRKVEPFWRKAKRFAIRNSDTLKEVGKIAAGVGLGIILGDSITTQ